MSRVKVIEVDDKPVAYVVPAEIWQRVKDLVEDAEDVADVERFDREDDGLRFPAEVACDRRRHHVHAEEDRGRTRDPIAALVS